MASRTPYSYPVPKKGGYACTKTRRHHACTLVLDCCLLELDFFSDFYFENDSPAE